MSQRNFKHAYKLIVSRQPTGFIAENPGFFENVGNAVEIEHLRVTFSVKRTLSKEPNPCELAIYNLSDHSRAELEKKPATVTLLAGYDSAPRLLFTGDIRTAWSEHNGVEWVTTIRAGDGARAFSEARMDSRSYKPPIKVMKVLSDAAASMNLPLPDLSKSPDLQQAMSVGISVHGPTRDVLTRLLAQYGYGWSVQNGALQIVRDGDVKGEAYVINKTTGMKGRPSRETSDKALKRLGVNIVHSLYPELFPSGHINLESENFSGPFRILEVVHTGDSHGEEWDTKIKARSL